MRMNLIKLMMICMAGISFFAVTGCGKQLPEFPEIGKCTFSWKYRKFRCTNTKTHESKNIPLDDPTMEGAQAVNLKDYEKSEAWVDDVERIAQEHCK